VTSPIDRTSLETLRFAVALLPRSDRRKLTIMTVLQMSLSALDLVGVLLIGTMAALGIALAQGGSPPALVQNFTSHLGISDPMKVTVVVWIAIAAAGVLIFKTVVSVIINRRILRFLAHRQALVGGRATQSLLSTDLLNVTARTSQETAFALTTGVNALTLRTIGNATIVLTELALLVVMTIGLLLVDPILTIVTVCFFGATAWMGQRLLSGWAHKLATSEAEMDIASMRSVQDAVSNFRELSVMHRQSIYAHRFFELREASTRSNADLQFVGQIPKYTFEIALVIGGFALCAVQFAYNDAATAIGSIALFLAASSRVTPSLLRLQGALLAIRGSSGTAQSIIKLIEALPPGFEDRPIELVAGDAVLTAPSQGAAARVQVHDVHFAYPNTNDYALQDISIEVSPGQSLAIVGLTGCGKSTLADVILGCLQPTMGRVDIDGVAPKLLSERRPGDIGYVPQHVHLVEGTVRDNVTLGLPRQFVYDGDVVDALEKAHLLEYLVSERDGLSTLVGEGGMRLSGGQRQRIGIARALYSKPSLLVLDEATSALDAETENSVSDAIGHLAGSVTTIIIAHRLSTVRNVDSLLYLERGRIVAQGTFEDLQREAPGFHRLVALNHMKQ
jgi:ABC-type multidrug transport system fused ATPase/permease subunit